ncbi:MAG: hypothetical protein ACFBSC_19275 [Microcoleaceae cyanobacterium]
MPIETIPGTNLKYYLVAFDASGNERFDSANPLTSDQILQQLQQQPITDIFLISHGWLSDIPAARRQYSHWIQTMLAQTADLEKMRQLRPGFFPCLVGLHWPSQPWGEYELTSSAMAVPSKTTTIDSTVNLVDQAVNHLVKQYAERIADTPAAHQALEVIFQSAMVNLAPDYLPLEVETAYRTLNQEATLGSDGIGAAPDADRESFNPDQTYSAARQEALSFSGFSWGGLLAPLRTLSFWQMKHRARQIGEVAGFRLLQKLQQVAAPEVKFHLIGHSFGCIFVSGMLQGSGLSSAPIRPVHSLSLLQGALSHWSYCPEIPIQPGVAGYFASVPQQVQGVMITTQSRFDDALGKWYPLAASAERLVTRSINFADVSTAEGGSVPLADYFAGFASDMGANALSTEFMPELTLPEYGAVGIFGAKGGAGFKAVEMKMRSPDTSYNFEPGMFYNLNGSEFIRGGNEPQGAHSDIDQPAVAHAVWEAAY